MDSTRSRPPRITSGRVGVALGVTALVVALGVPSQAAKVINGKSLKNNSVTSQKIKNGTLTGTDVKDDSITGADVLESSLTGLLRPADVAVHGALDEATVNDFKAPAFTPVVSTTFTTPSDGFLHITGTISAEDDSTFSGIGRLVFRLRLDDAPLTTGLFAHEMEYPSSGGGTSGAATSVVPVSIGDHTVHLDARELGTGSFLLGREVSVLFVPTGSGIDSPGARTLRGSTASPQG